MTMFAEKTKLQLPEAVRWTRDDCAAFEKAGFLNYRYELIEGVIYKMSQNIRHARFIIKVIMWLVGLFGEDFVFSQTTIDVSPEDNPTSIPMPDAGVLNTNSESIWPFPKPSQILFCIELSDTTLDYDLYMKAGLYARAGIPEYWVIDIPGRKLHVHRDPSEGEYQSITVHTESEFVSLLSKPEARVQISEFLPNLKSDSRIF